jgi:hypothetical protein
MATVVVNAAESAAAFQKLFILKTGQPPEEAYALSPLLAENDYLFEATLNDCVSLRVDSLAADPSILLESRFSGDAHGLAASGLVLAIRREIAPTFGVNKELVGKRGAAAATAQLLDTVRDIVGQLRQLSHATLQDLCLVVRAALHYALPELLDAILFILCQKYLQLLSNTALMSDADGFPAWLEHGAPARFFDVLLDSYELLPQYHRDECFRLLISYGWRMDPADQSFARLSPVMQHFANIEREHLEADWIKIKRRGLHPTLAVLTRLPFRLIGQHRIAADVVSTMKQHWYQRKDSKCLVMVFAGKTGTGKTELAQEIGRLTSGDGAPCHHITDCGLINTRSELFGNSGFYKGGDKPTALSAFVSSRSGQFGVVILDEFDRLRPCAKDALYSIWDKGQFINFQGDSSSQTAVMDCSRIMFVLTTNFEFSDDDQDSSFRMKLGASPNWGPPLTARIGGIFLFKPLIAEKKALAELFLQLAARDITVGHKLQPNSRPRHLHVDPRIAPILTGNSEGAVISDDDVRSSGIRFIRDRVEEQLKAAVVRYEEGGAENSVDCKTLLLEATPQGRTKIKAVALS